MSAIEYAWVCDIEEIVRRAIPADGALDPLVTRDWDLRRSDPVQRLVQRPGTANPGWMLIPTVHRDRAGGGAFAAVSDISAS